VYAGFPFNNNYPPTYRGNMFSGCKKYHSIQWT